MVSCTLPEWPWELVDVTRKLSILGDTHVACSEWRWEFVGVSSCTEPVAVPLLTPKFFARALWPHQKIGLVLMDKRRRKGT